MIEKLVARCHLKKVPSEAKAAESAVRTVARRVGLAVGACVLLVSATLTGATSASAATVYAVYHVTTDVSARTTATAAPTNVYGIPAGQAFGVECQQIGEPVGPKGNTLYLYVLYGGREFYVPDTWTDSPHLAGQPPIAGIPMCSSVIVASAPVPPTTINGHDIGYPQNDWHGWGACTVRDYKGGEFDWTIVSTTAGTHIVHNGMLWGWFDNGGAPGSLGCPTTDEYAWNTGVRQDFQGGSLFWHPGMDHAVRTSRAALQAISYFASHLNQDWLSGWCLQAVHDSYASAGLEIGGSGTNADGYARQHQGQLNASTNPPPGAIVLWYGTRSSTDYHPDGHVALSVGGGYALSTSERQYGTVHVLSIADRNAYPKPYAGWFMP